MNHQTMRHFISLLLLFSMQSAGGSLQQWKQVEISWQAPGEKTVNRAVLLRSDSFLRQQHIQVGYDRASGITVHSIQPWHGSIPGRQPVITGIFKYRSNRVETFTFISQSRRKFQLQATGTHPVYVNSLHRYVNLNDVTPDMTLRNDRGEVIHIQCPDSFSRHCGRADAVHQLQDVYDLEVNGTHAYFAGHIPVHNVCVPNLQTIASRVLIYELLKNKAGDIGHAIDTICTTRRLEEWVDPSKDLLEQVVLFLKIYNQSIFPIAGVFYPLEERGIFIDAFMLSLFEQETGRNLFDQSIRRSQRWVRQGMDLKMNKMIFLKCHFYKSVRELKALDNSTGKMYTTYSVYYEYMTPGESTGMIALPDKSESLREVCQFILKKRINQFILNVDSVTSSELVRLILGMKKT